MSSFQVTNSVRMRGETCWSCGIQFAMPEVWARTKEVDGSGFKCPAGCPLRYGKSQMQELEEKLSAQRRLTEWAERRTVKERLRHRATKGHLTRQKKRTAAGVCPCCNRSFKALQRHMKSKHPDYAKD